VREAVEHPVWGTKFVQALLEEVLPGLPLAREEMLSYAQETLERFRNPYIHHRLSDIAMNSLSKWKTRVLPSLKAFVDLRGRLPPLLTESLASLLRLYRPADSPGDPAGRRLDGTVFPLHDDPGLLQLIASVWQEDADGHVGPALSRILAEEKFWGEDLTRIPGLTETVIRNWIRWEEGPDERYPDFESQG
jgi:tagaturonate reductase